MLEVNVRIESSLEVELGLWFVLGGGHGLGDSGT